MPRNRIIYQVETLHVADNATGAHFQINGSGLSSDVYADFVASYPSLATGINEATFIANTENLVNQFHRVQSASSDFSLDRTMVQQFGQLGHVDDPIINPPTVNLGFNYLLANFHNENIMGLVVDGSSTCISGLLDKSSDEKNYYIKQANEGVNAIGDASENGDSIGFGNSYLSSYTVEASVGGFPNASLSVQALNMSFENEISGDLPSIFPENGTNITGYQYKLPLSVASAGTGDLDISVLRPGDLTLSFYKRDADDGPDALPTGVFDIPGMSVSDVKIQSFNLSFDLSREVIQQLGSKFGISREITFPVDVNLSIEAILGDLTPGKLSDIINCDDSYDVIIDMKKPECDPLVTERTTICRYTLKKSKLDSESFSEDIGSNKTVSFSLTSQLGGAEETDVGLFLSGLA